MTFEESYICWTTLLNANHPMANLAEKRCLVLGKGIEWVNLNKEMTNEQALRLYEREHKAWMNKPVWNNCNEWMDKEISKAVYLLVTKREHPDWIVM